MEPATLIVSALLTVGSAATARSPWSAPRIEGKQAHTVMVEAIVAPTNVLIAPPANETPLVTLKDRLLRELDQFSPESPNSDPGITTSPEDIEAAKTILKVLPAGLPLPTLMRNDDGQIGMYWDSDYAYADMNIEPGRTFSFFSRSRFDGKERFSDMISVERFSSTWAYEHLSLLVDDQLAAA